MFFETFHVNKGKSCTSFKILIVRVKFKKMAAVTFSSKFADLLIFFFHVSLQGTYYGEYGGGGKCSIDPRVLFTDEANWITVAAGPENYKGSLGCGMCVSITGTGEGLGGNPIKGTYKAVVNNECSECEEGKNN